jgi:NAD(P)-dependent dehydrogenase (short-subunit alcohol dehydrogenase family)
MARFDDKVVLITGIGGGMGREAALRFAAEGAKVVGCDMVADGATETVDLVRAAGGDITNFAPVNLADAKSS